eukprot:8067960-Pyramimonas_sp.AAC.1
MVRKKTIAVLHRTAPLPRLTLVGRHNQIFRLRRSPYPTLLYRSSDSPRSRRESRERQAMSSEYVFGLNGK